LKEAIDRPQPKKGGLKKKREDNPHQTMGKWGGKKKNKLGQQKFQKRVPTDEIRSKETLRQEPATILRPPPKPKKTTDGGP